jgi:hypothetical protein
MFRFISHINSMYSAWSTSILFCSSTPKTNELILKHRHRKNSSSFSHPKRYVILFSCLIQSVRHVKYTNSIHYYTFSMYSRSWLVREHRIILNIRYLLRNLSCWRAQRPIIVFFYRTCIQKILLDAVVPNPRRGQQLKPKIARK